MKKTYTRALVSMLVFSPGLAPLSHAQEASEEELPVLETFIAEESAGALTDTVLPTDRDISGLFGDTTSILEVPRSVTLLSPELMDQFNIEDLGDLEKVGAGTQAYNYYGVPGTPVIRGAKGGTFLNGMLRAYQRNEMPLSFGSLEAIEIVKGPAPADFSPTQIGGFVNLIPKSPYFDKERGSIELEVDNWGRQTVTADYGAPFLLPGETPAAFRVSLTSQDGESYYDDFQNDYTSVYGSIKFRPKDGVSVFLGGEYFDFQSNENPGWNRPTQDLIDNGNYIIGEPLVQTSGAWRGTVDRDALYGTNPISGLPAAYLALERSVAEALVPSFGNLADMLLVTDVDGLDKYVYTQDYFDNGGRAVTQKIEGSDVLTDPNDFADSEDIVLFGDIVFDSNPDRTYFVKGIFETLTTDKRSSYGYAVSTEQTVFGSKAFVRDRTWLPNTTTTVGAGARYTDAQILQDFFDEPFSRRDLLQPTISPNTVLLVGDQRPVGGLNLWSPTAVGGANVESQLMQLALFASFETDWTEQLSTIASVRAEYADFDIGLPSEAERAAAAGAGPILEAESGDTDYINWSFGPNFEVVDGVFLYGNIQAGTSLDPTQGGAIFGEQNFAENEMWEIGVKASLIEDRLFASLAYYDWEQSQFNTRAGASEELEGEGVEVEFTWLATDKFTLIGSYTWQEVRRVAPPGFRTMPAPVGVDEDEYIALNAGTLLLGDFGFGNTRGNTDYVYPGAPQTVIKFFGIYEFDNGFSISGGPVWRDEFYHNIDNTLEIPDSLVWNLNLAYETEKWAFGLSIDNLTNEDYFLGADPIFGANTLVTKAPETTYIFSAKYKF